MNLSITPRNIKNFIYSNSCFDPCLSSFQKISIISLTILSTVLFAKFNRFAVLGGLVVFYVSKACFTRYKKWATLSQIPVKPVLRPTLPLRPSAPSLPQKPTVTATPSPRIESVIPPTTSLPLTPVVSVPSPSPSHEPEVVTYKLLGNLSARDRQKLFADRQVRDLHLSGDAIYRGANRQEIVVNGQKISLPKTLYHLLFIYFSLQEVKDKYPTFPLLTQGVHIPDAIHLETVDQDNQLKLEATIRNFHEKLGPFLKENSIEKWINVCRLVDKICVDLQTLSENRDNRPEITKTRAFLFFYNHCLFQGRSTEAKARGVNRFKEITLRALALEWNSDPDKRIIYRASQLACDDLEKEGHPHSLSFGDSLFSGIIFEGAPGGTCPLVYYVKDRENKTDLYSLTMTNEIFDRYFFEPRKFNDYSLLSLTAQGEYSHIRLKVFWQPQDELTKTSGVIHQGGSEILTLYQYASIEIDMKHPDIATYRERIAYLFQNGIAFLSSAR